MDFLSGVCNPLKIIEIELKKIWNKTKNYIKRYEVIDLNKFFMCKILDLYFLLAFIKCVRSFAKLQFI
tara:strand:- start:324 stop:527 length:204 start_codon:yes stop_codon:yes gene_type:complete